MTFGLCGVRCKSRKTSPHRPGAAGASYRTRGATFFRMLDMPKLTAKREAMNLYHHGTVKWHLTPNTVHQAARQDIRSREFNTWLREERERLNPNALGYKQELKQLPKRRR